MYILYLCVLVLNYAIMEKIITTKRKNIDLKIDTFKALSIQAVEQGESLKSYIESILDFYADKEDLAMYFSKIKNNANCWEFLSEQEQNEFEKQLGII